MPKPIQEQMDAVKKELKQAQNRLKVLENRKRDTERRARTHRLIERGAILESIVDGMGNMTNEQVKEMLIIALGTKEAKEYLQAQKVGVGNP